MKGRLTKEAKRLFKKAFVELASENDDPEISEAAFPAYAHGNPLIDRVFWGRLAAAEDHLATLRPRVALDFGCGSGVMLHILSGLSERVDGTDSVPETFELMKAKVPLPGNVGFVGIDDIRSEAYRERYDAIVALDVLEHVDDLPQTLYLFKRLLKPGGEVVISGPTENALYRLGRRIAGRKFTGDYHVSDIRKIRSECAAYGKVSHIKTIYPILPLFDVFSLKFD